MSDRREIRLDILIKREEDYYIGHCLQFDLVATDNTINGVQKAIIDLCIAHIQFSYKHDNMEYMFSPAPKELWAEYYALVNDQNCLFECRKLQIDLEDKTLMIPPFIVQEILCNEQSSCRTEI